MPLLTDRSLVGEDPKSVGKAQWKKREDQKERGVCQLKMFKVDFVLLQTAMHLHQDQKVDVVIREQACVG